MPTRVGFPAGFLALHNRQVITMKNDYYTYAYLREDGTPYYIGKGRGKRAFSRARKFFPPPRERILLLKQNLTEEEAFKHEVYMIAVLGRKDLGTGILRNLTDGGEGTSGFIHSESTKALRRGKRPPEVGEKIRQAKLGGKHSTETREKIRQAKLGTKTKPCSEETKAKIGKANQGHGRPWSEKRWEAFKRKGKKVVSKEAREKMRQSAIAGWEKRRKNQAEGG